ncbi:endonuclease/exonuclease/phosphatase family protein [Parabacteroides bouchesdurhonensis]|uniref:endonuclease/exonuclease/phosphatase family protein n=1 Tax=Parabacteroides bouchesdurhonensis TaxID=1936995 RepID=UPI000E501991|nr:endonuclease/exonuclease/phosphatase family protein [Parabacteroides bouchesdurhonensis]RHJ95008.1 endonuclease [Bacteroides sp. AM07-16]
MKRWIVYITTLLLLPITGIWAGNNLQERNTLRIMSYNIRNAKGMDDMTNYQRVADVINQIHPNVVAVQEIDSVTGRSGGNDVLRELAERTLMFRTYAPAINYDGGRYGIGVLSKEKPINSRYLPLPGREEARVLLAVEFEKYIFCCTHLSLTPEDQILSLPIIRQLAKEANKPFFIAGDWNATPTSSLLADIQKDFTIITNPKQLTFPADVPDCCLDYIAIYKTTNLPITCLSSHVCNEPVASDHRPVVADIVFKADKKDIFLSSPYLQNPFGNGITVMWQTTVPAYSWVEYGTDTLNLHSALTLLDGQVICNGLHNKVRLDNLKPGQKYYYRICSQEIMLYQAYKKIFGETAISPFYSFTLPTTHAEDFTAIIFNDLHKEIATLDGLYGQIKNIPYDFVIFNGDCVAESHTEEEALSFLSYTCRKVKASEVPTFFLRGNHEIRDAFSIGLRDLFDYVGDKTYGAFNWGDTRFVMLDCGEDKPDTTWVYYGLNDFTGLRQEQVGFLANELSCKSFKKSTKRVLIGHVPVYGNTDKYQPCTEIWGGLLAKAPFDINISAHTHQYAYHSKGSLGNNFPVVIGGGCMPEEATVMVLQKKGKEMNLRVMNIKGEEILNLKL